MTEDLALAVKQWPLLDEDQTMFHFILMNDAYIQTPLHLNTSFTHNECVLSRFIIIIIILLWLLLLFIRFNYSNTKINPNMHYILIVFRCINVDISFLV